MRNSSTHSPAARRIRALLAVVVTPIALVAAEADDIRALRERIRLLEQELLIIERKQELREEAAAAAPPPIVGAGPSGFSLGSADRKYHLRIRANLQADGRFFRSDHTDGNDTFLLRRLRPSFEGVLAERFGFRLMPDLAPATFSLLDAYVTYHPTPAFNVLVGKTKSPFDLERLISQTDLLFIERAHPTSLAPNRDIGVQLYGELGAGTFSYQVGWLNGARDNESTITDADDAKEVVVRLFLHPLANAAGSLLQGLGFGIAVGQGEKNAGAPNSYRTHAQQTFFAWRATVVSSGEHLRYEPQAYYYYGPFGLSGAWIASRQELSNGAGTATRTLENRAWYVAAQWVLTGEDASYRGVLPRTNFVPGGSWGAWEIAARYSELEIDDAAFPTFANPATAANRAKAATLGLNWHLNRNVKASLNLEHTRFAGGAANPVTREDERAILTRVQLRY